MKVKLLPRTKSKSLKGLDKNENLLTSSAYKLLTLTNGLADKLNIKSVISQLNDSEYDIIISRWMGEEIEKMDKSKPIYEFHYCILNGGFFFERYSFNDIQYTLNDNEKEMTELLGDIFFRIDLKFNHSL